MAIGGRKHPIWMNRRRSLGTIGDPETRVGEREGGQCATGSLDPSGSPTATETSRRREIGSADCSRLSCSSAARWSSADRLAELLWPDRLPADQASALQTHVFRLRRVLPEGAIETVGAGYRLAATADDIDAHHFAELVTDAIAEGSGGPLRALALLDEALSLWRGQPFEELAETDAGRIEAARLGELAVARASSGSSPSPRSVGTVTRVTAWPSSSRSRPSIRSASGRASCSWLRSMSAAAAPKHLARTTTSGDGSPTSWGSPPRPSCRRCTTRSCPERRAVPAHPSVAAARACRSRRTSSWVETTWLRRSSNAWPRCVSSRSSGRAE